MNIDQLRYLVEATNCGSFSGASKTLFITPEAVSKAIAELEKELGIKLFARSGRSISPTESGLLFVEEAKLVLQSVFDLKCYAKSLSAQSVHLGHFSLAVATTAYRGMIYTSNDFDRFRDENPSIELDLLFGSSEACLAALMDGGVNAAVVLGPLRNSEYASNCICSIKPQIITCAENSKREIGDEQKELLIANPQDYRYLSKLLNQRLSQISLNARLISLPLHVDEQVEFLKSGGKMLTLDNAKIYEYVKCDRDLELEEALNLSIPVCFIYGKDGDLESCYLVYRYLKTISSIPRRVK